MAATKRSANGRQLLLLAALLFGIVTMHTLGHPTGHSASHPPNPSSSHSTSRSADGHSMSQAADGHSTSLAPSRTPSRAPVHASGPEQAARHHQAPMVTSADVSVDSGVTGTGGMDPLSVCLAVLAALALVLLLKAGLLRPGGFAVAARPLARPLDGLRPNPPPPRILLSRLSVLRI
ncbi:hypothetical protein GCM10010277_26030 [Streptomyces longisporoflavus]|uniref:hypothetical protein n=1 Tax=Streptomyces longisporoflavus TaxID=28044 RepID=UPI00167CA069|nr:hypothetical protein [Streptomyces longisporoflavus]GGV38700.1 hypothetical protein GCM10010277_26030 [Streptomyces longisporoflavus]